jgi:hypothetical protein
LEISRTTPLERRLQAAATMQTKLLPRECGVPGFSFSTTPLQSILFI